MKLTKKLQYGILLGLYLSRSGRASITAVAGELKLSSSLLQQVANTLRKHGVINGVRGPGGGFELAGDPILLQFFNALAPVTLFDWQDIYAPSQEFRALSYWGCIQQDQIKASLNISIRTVMQSRIDLELGHFKHLKEGSIEQ